MPVPATSRRSTPSAAAIFRTTGLEYLRTRSSSPSGSVDGSSTAGSATAGSGVSAAGSEATSGSGPVAAPSGAVPPVDSPGSPRIATTTSTATVAPSSNLISSRTPAAGLGISASTLSVEISNSGWSRSTRSPTLTNHRVTVPSAMDSPICGMITSVAIYFSVLRSGSSQVGQMWIAWPLAAWAASAMASDRVGCACIVRNSSSVVDSIWSATQASAIRSVAFGPMT